MQAKKNSVENQDILTGNMVAFHSFLRQSYDSAKKQWSDGVTFFKDEFSTLRDRTGNYLNSFVLPVNNFLKEVDQIDSELQFTRARNSSSIIPIEIAAAISAGEENY